MNFEPSARARRVWKRLTDWYGARLGEMFGEEPPPDWCEIVDQADNEPIKTGLSKIRTTYTAHPPTLPQFAAAMRPARHVLEVGPSNAERLAEFAMRQVGRQLTPKQIREPWLYGGERFAATNAKGEIDPRGGARVTSVSILADGERPGYRFTLEDLAAEQADPRAA